MLSSITPLGERAKQNRWGVTATAYIVGSVLGGALLGLVLSPLAALAAGISTTAALVASGIVLFAAAAADLAGLRPPSIHRQVDENWLTAYRGVVYGFGFGIQLGFGVVTIITSWSMWATLAMIVLCAGGAGFEVPWPLPFAPMLTGATFGSARGLVLLAARGVTDNESLASLHQRIASGAGRTARGVTWSMASLGLLATATLVGGVMA
ncbi:MAG: hypothetical protein ACK5O2_03530 [Microthrixaceae bacterium]